MIGTSLKVAPVSEVSGFLPPETPQIYISREVSSVCSIQVLLIQYVLTHRKPCQHVDFDIDMLGECDTIVTELCRRAGWDLKHEMIKEDDISVQLHEGYESRYSFRIGTA